MDEVVENQGKLFEYAEDYCPGMDIEDFIDHYMNSRTRSLIDEGQAYVSTLKWTVVAKRIDELIAVGRYMSNREMEYLPEYEKDVLARDIHSFFRDQPKTFLRPYPYGSDYYRAIEQIRPQLDDLKQVKEILSMMEEVLAGTADYDRRYPSMQQT